MNFKDSKPPHPLRNIANLSKLFKTSNNPLSCSRSIPKQPKPPKQILQYCNNHPSIPSTHKIQQQEETLYYCDKCSNLLQKQGFLTSPLLNSHQSKMFIDKLTHSLSQIHHRKSQTLMKQDKLLFNYEKSVKKIAAYKESILAKIEDLFENQLKNANQNLKKQMSQIESERQYLSNYEKQMKSMMKDIQQNLNGIDRLPSQSFISAMAQYTAVLTKYQTQSKTNSKPTLPLPTTIPHPNSPNPSQPPQPSPMQQSLTINQNSNIHNNLDNMIFSLSDTLKGLSYEGTLFSDRIRMVQSMHHDMSLTQESIVEYRETSRIQSLF